MLICLPDQCLVDANGSEKYVALSYVWGCDQTPLATTKSNLEHLREKNSFSSPCVRNRLPGAIRRAMEFTRLLGVEFLWVDRLCIVQDDPVHATSQINSMGSIYSGSYLTLCASDGQDAATSLRGIEQCSEPRNIVQEVLDFDDGAGITRWAKNIKYEDTPYPKRGWIFQEQVLSPRKLSFTGSGLSWECQTVRGNERDIEDEPIGYSFGEYTIVHEDTLWPCLKKWDNLLTAFLRRVLTYKSDILRAFSGIVEALGDSALGDFHYGLPEQFFDAALLWIPEDSLTRRRDETRGSQADSFPSWSWAGWEGAVSSQIDYFGLCHEHSNSFEGCCQLDRNIYPCVAWFKVNLESVEDRMPEIQVLARARSRRTYSFYHVLWIEWCGNIAERRGLGRVDQSVWDALPQSNITVHLG
ncbi:heterokaryon incompatibility protein-domain-containing protein [Exophiala viscosa]|uniref:heterokaryon incompatibility protein-domain-containing protein n=1 Tax=Exophiala viscosa TaxID=2486360 RepID=UPI00219E7435|nr:heterokaryon incompatibility protein-domain-containing protein [Exophiala viscosa]